MVPKNKGLERTIDKWLGGTFRVIVLASITAFLSACAHPQVHELQAPSDAYVCFQSSFDGCLNTIQNGSFVKFETQTYHDVFKANSIEVIDADSGTIVESSDKSLRCEFGTIPYSAILKTDEVKPIVLVPTALIEQLAEEMVHVSRIRKACANTLRDYDFQNSVIELQDEQAGLLKTLGYLNAEYIESLQLSQLFTSGHWITNDLIKKNNLLMPKDVKPNPSNHQYDLAAVIKSERQRSLALTEEIREDLKGKALTSTKKGVDGDFVRQVDDAQLAINISLRDVAHLEHDIEAANYVYSGQRILRMLRENRSWVRQGSAIAKVESTQPTNQ